MKSKLLNEADQKTYAIVMDPGDDVMENLKAFAKEKELSAAQFTAIGAFSEATTGFYDFEIKDYKRNIIREQTEVLSLIGDVSLYNGVPKVHAHVVLGKVDGTAHGGHLIHAIAKPTLEIILTESPTYLKRTLNHAMGLPLIDF